MPAGKFLRQLPNMTPVRLHRGMGNDMQKLSGKPRKETDVERRERLASALRQNLARRKAQGRARKAAGDGDGNGTAASPEVEEK
jgi:hypothetical protein